MDQLCPWQDWIQASITFCEEMGCSWIRQPANTWSNLAYTVSGFVVYQTARKEGAGFLSQIGVIAMILSFGSFFFHASSTFIGEVFDVGAMFIFANFAFALMLHRISSWEWSAIWRLFWILNVVCIATLITVKWIGILLFTAQVTVVTLLEMRQFWRRRGSAFRTTTCSKVMRFGTCLTQLVFGSSISSTNKSVTVVSIPLGGLAADPKHT